MSDLFDKKCLEMEVEEENDEFGIIVGDDIYSPIDLLEHCGYDCKNVNEKMSWQEFEELYPDLWTYPLTNMIECLRNNDEVMIVKFFDPSTENGFIYRACQASE